MTAGGEVARADRRDRDPLPTVEVEACPACGSPRASELFRAPDRVHGAPGSFRFVRCGTCRTVYQSPRVADEALGRAYPQLYYTHDASPLPEPGEGSGAVVRRVRERARAAVRGEGGGAVGALLAGLRPVREKAFFGLIDAVIPRSPEPGRALEVGPGRGWELRLLADAGWDAEGLEWDEDAARVAEATSGRPVSVGGLLETEPPPGRYALVYLSHVLEHLPDPRAFARWCAVALEPGGRAVVRTPNPDALGARRWGRDWIGWDPPRHLVLPTGEGLERAAGGTDLSVEWSTRGRDTAPMMAWSRAVRAGRPLAEEPVGAADRWAAVKEDALVAAGRPVGEELVGVFGKPAP